MKPGIHPEYRPVVFRDTSTGDEFLSRSTATSSRTVTWSDGLLAIINTIASVFYYLRWIAPAFLGREPIDTPSALTPPVAGHGSVPTPPGSCPSPWACSAAAFGSGDPGRHSSW